MLIGAAGLVRDSCPPFGGPTPVTGIGTGIVAADGRGDTGGPGPVIGIGTGVPFCDFRGRVCGGHKKR